MEFGASSIGLVSRSTMPLRSRVSLRMPGLKAEHVAPSWLLVCYAVLTLRWRATTSRALSCLPGVMAVCPCLMLTCDCSVSVMRRVVLSDISSFVWTL